VLQVLVDEGDRHAALAHRGGDALDRAEPHVAGSKNLDAEAKMPPDLTCDIKDHAADDRRRNLKP